MTEDAKCMYENETSEKNSNDGKTLKEIICEVTEQELVSFPNDTVTVEQLKLMADKQSARVKRRRNRMIAATAVFFVALIGVLLAFGDLFENVEADKNAQEGIVTEDGVVIEDGGWGSISNDIVETTDWEEVAEIKYHFEELIIPRVIPKGYSFEKLIISDVGSDDMNSEYRFVSNNNEMIIHQFLHFNSLNSFEQENYDKTIESDKGKIYIRNDNENTIATIAVSGGCIVKIWGISDTNTIVDIVDGLEF